MVHPRGLPARSLAARMALTATVSAIPPCDLCKDGTPARYDGKTVFGPWANLCVDHFLAYGIGLGTGLGQRLILKARE